MICKRSKFYEKIINKIILNKKASILVVGATEYDSNIFKKNDYINVTISNLDENGKYHPYKHSLQDLRKLKFNDENFDYVVANACIHHTSVPHNAILEMFRVSKKGTIVIEGNDSYFMRICNYLNLSQEFELSAVTNKDNSYDLGGVDNSNIPNFVYRWTKREVIKLISSYSPQFIYKIKFFYDSDFEGYKKVRKVKYLKPFLYFLEIIAKIYFFIFSNERNLFCFYINKDQRKLQKWLEINNKNKIQVNKKYLNNET